MVKDQKVECSASKLVVQISDTHLCADPNRKLRGINTQESLKAVLQLAAEHLKQASHIFITGDISHDESAGSYSFLAQELSNYSGVKRFLPGNHDNPETLLSIYSQPIWPSADRLGSWLLIGLNTQLEGKTAGYLDSSQLEKLRILLVENEHQHTLVALHHPPVLTGSQWMDEISLLNQRHFRQLLKEHPQVKAVIYGHAHQEKDEIRDDIRWLCCPSTCVQFLPNKDVAYSDTLLPGYRWLQIFDDGNISTGVERIAEWPHGSGPDRRKWSK